MGTPRRSRGGRRDSGHAAPDVRSRAAAAAAPPGPGGARAAPPPRLSAAARDIRSRLAGGAPRPRPASPPDAAPRPGARVAHPPSCRCACAGSSSCAPAHRWKAACRCYGYPWPADLLATHPLQHRGDLLALLLHHGFELGDPLGWRRAPVVRLHCKSGWTVTICNTIVTRM
jgi:hypothetical protein